MRSSNYNHLMKVLLGEIMYNKNLSVNQVSRMTGIPHTTIVDIKNGRSSPRLDTLEKLAKGLKIRISDLYESDYK